MEKVGRGRIHGNPFFKKFQNIYEGASKVGGIPDWKTQRSHDN